MSTARHISFRARLLCAAGALLVSAVAAPAQQRQQLDPRLQQEARYVQALVKAGFQSYADEVVQELKRDYPGADILLKQMDVELKLMLGNWKEVMATIAKEPKDSAGYWAMQLKMADYLFAFGRYHTDPNDKDKVPGAIDIYDQLLKMEKPPEAIAADYQNALFTYAQMLVMLGNDAKACDVYKRLMTLPGISNDAKRQFTFEYAQLQVKIAEKGGGDKASRIQQARDAVKGLLWNQDLWFGRSVALLAHIFVLEGKLAEANKIVEDYEDQLIDFDQMLDEAGKQDKADYSAMSPLAECRYLQGTMLMDDGMKKLEKAAPRSKEETEAVESIAQSIDYLVEVFSGYPSFAWAPDAMSRVEQMRDKLLELGFRIEDPLTEQDRVRVAEKQFESAKVAFNQNQFKEAMETYQSALKTF